MPNKQVDEIPLVDRAKHEETESNGKKGSSKLLPLLFIGAIVIALIIALVVGFAEYDQRPMYRYEMSSENAICNDGTRAAFYVRPALPGPHENYWIVRFEGGNICFDDVSCEARWEGEDHEFMTTMPDAEMYADPNGGLLSSQESQNPFWYDANVVHIHYCSSDAWSGNSLAEDNDSRFNFMGSHIVDTVFVDLVEQHGMDEASHILIAGFSAGGQLVVGSGWRIGEYLNEAVPQAEKRILCDSGWFLISSEDFEEAEGWGSCETFANCPFHDLYTLGWEFWKPRVNEECLATGLTYECMFAEYAYEYTSKVVDVLVAQHQYDVMHLLTSGVPTGDYSVGDAEWEYAKYYRNYIVDSLNSTAAAVWSSGCHVHDTTNHDWWTNIKLVDSRMNLDTALQLWWFEGQDIKEFDPCVDSADIDCNPSCPPIDTNYLPTEDDEEDSHATTPTTSPTTSAPTTPGGDDADDAPPAEPVDTSDAPTTV